MKTAIDERKPIGLRGLDLLTGMKVGTYDLPKSKLVELSKGQRDILESVPQVREGQYFYVPEKFKETMTPEAQAAVKQQISTSDTLTKMMKALREKRLREKATSPTP